MDTPHEQAEQEQPESPLATIAAAAFALIGFTLIYIEAGSFGAAARIFPRTLSLLGGISAAVVLLQAIARLRTPREVRIAGAPLDRRDLIISYVIPVAYAVAMYLFGFWASSVVCLAGLMILLGERRYLLVAAITIGTLLTIYLVFSLGFSIRMPKGLILEMLQD